jgi:hypothetical protein
VPGVSGEIGIGRENLQAVPQGKAEMLKTERLKGA